MMSRLGLSGAMLLVAFAAACDGSSPTQPEAEPAAKKVDTPDVNLAAGCAGSTVQIRQVFSGNTRWPTTLNSGDKYWNAGNNMFSCGSYLFEDYMLIVPARRTVGVELWGGNDNDSACSRSPAGKLGDPYLYIFDYETKALVASDDDAGCGFNSYLSLPNDTAAGKRYIVRVTTYGEREMGQALLNISLPDRGASLSKPLW